MIKKTAIATAACDFETLELTLGSGAELLSLGLLRGETVIAHHKTDGRKREVGVNEVRHGKVLVSISVKNASVSYLAISILVSSKLNFGSA